MCFTVQLSMFSAVFLTAFVFYHITFGLSRTFLTFLKKFFHSCFFHKQLDYTTMFVFLCQELFYFFKFLLTVLKHSFVRISYVCCFVKNFFRLFSYLFQIKCQGLYPLHLTEKEGFEPSHGANRLYP